MIFYRAASLIIHELGIRNLMQIMLSTKGDCQGSLSCLATRHCQPFPKQQILDSSDLKEFADDSFIFHENGRKLSKKEENTVGKGEIACYEQFLLFPHVFITLVMKTCKNQGLFGEELGLNQTMKL